MSRRLSSETARKMWRWVLGFSALYVGFGYAFGPETWYQSPSLELVRQFIVPVPVWGGLMMLAGGLILSRLRPWGHYLAMLLWTFWFSCIAVISVASLATWVLENFGVATDLGFPEITGWGAPMYVLVYAMVHAHMVLGPPSEVYVIPAEPCE